MFSDSDRDCLTVPVELGPRRYDILIGTKILSRLPELVTARRRVSHALLISDNRVAPIFADSVHQSLTNAGIRVTPLIVPAGEPSKSVAQADRLWQEAIAAGTDRKTIVIALGGGVIGDLAGFIAATLTRGLDFYQVPTTLLAQVDSSVGGKVGINLPVAKNIVGAFWQPKGVLIDTAVLETLPTREYRSGLAEVVKYGVILDPQFFAYLEENIAGLNSRNPQVLRQIIARSCQLKAQVVAQDETETTGLRAILNYGHTFCHALETVGGYGKLLHGEAVSIGMLCASRLGESLGVFDGELTARQAQLLAALDLPIQVPDLPVDQLMAAMLKDKKVEHGKLRFIVPHAIGNVVLTDDVPLNLAEQALRDGIASS